MVAGIPTVQSALRCFMNAIWVCYGCSHMSALCHTVRGSSNCLYVATLSCMLLTGHTHTHTHTQRAVPSLSAHPVRSI
jgi:hypothetical protein